MPTIPDAVRAKLSVYREHDGHVTIETPDELSPILGWLSGLPVDEVTIEPIGLRAVYDQYHAAPNTTSRVEKTPAIDSTASANT